MCSLAERLQGLEVQVARLRISRDKLLAEVDSLSAELERLGLENTALIQARPLAINKFIPQNPEQSHMPDSRLCAP